MAEAGGVGIVEGGEKGAAAGSGANGAAGEAVCAVGVGWRERWQEDFLLRIEERSETGEVACVV